MPARQATTLAQRREMLRLVEEGYTYTAVAEQVGVSFGPRGNGSGEGNATVPRTWGVAMVAPRRDL